MNVKVSVILPVYNVEMYLKECLDSLMNQTLYDCEFICVDDGSTDSSPEIIKEYAGKDQRFKAIYQKNLYAGVARNNGLKEAKGEYIVFLDSDDFFEPTMLEKIYKKGIQTSADVIFYGARMYDNNSREYKDAPWYFHKEYIGDKEVFNRKDFPEQILSITSPAPWTKAFSRKFILKENIEFQPLQNSNDLFFTLTAVGCAERIAWIDEMLVNYRVGLTNNIQSRKQKAPSCFMQAYKELYDEFTERGIINELEKSYITVALSGIAFNLRTMSSENSFKKVITILGEDYREFVQDSLLKYNEEYYLHIDDYNEVKAALRIYDQLKKLDNQKQNNHIYQVRDNTWLHGQDPKVSVIIPIYNVEKYLRKCLDSIVLQTLKEIEIICVVDGSPDHSIDIVNEYAKQDQRIKVITQKNMGLSASRNHGIKEATGKYIYFMDSDDILELCALKEMYECAEKYQLEILYFDAVCFSDDDDIGDILEKNKNQYIRKYEYPISCSGIEMFNKMTLHDEFKSSACLQLLNRDFVISHHLSFHEGVLHEDNSFSILAMLLAETCGHIPNKYFHRRYRSQSIMTNEERFDNSYGYYISYKDIEKKKEIFNAFSCDDQKCIYEMMMRLLRNSRDIFARLSYDEQSAYKALDLHERMDYEILVASAGRIKEELIYKQKLLQRTYDEKYERGLEIKRLKKELRKTKRFNPVFVAKAVGRKIIKFSK